MGTEKINKEQIVEAYLQEVIQPMIVESLGKMEQLSAASQTLSEGDATIVKAIEELRQQKAEGPNLVLWKRDDVLNGIKEAVEEEVCRLDVKASLDRDHEQLLARLSSNFASWNKSTRTRIESNEQVKRKQKRFVWILVPLVALLLLFGGLWIKHLRSPERWASMAYAAAVELGIQGDTEYYGRTINCFLVGKETGKTIRGAVRDLKKEARKARREKRRQYRKSQVMP